MAPIRAVVDKFIEENEMSYYTFAALAHVNHRFLYASAPKWVHFDMADKMINATGDNFAWHRGELKEIYQQVNLGTKPCGRPSCPKTFQASKNGQKAFCSEVCKNAHGRALRSQAKVRAGVKNPGRAHVTHCRNGHERSEENTKIAKDGTRRCRTCQNDRERERHGRRKASRDAA